MFKSMRVRKQAFWTPEKIERLKALATPRLYTAYEIADDLGCNRHQVVGKAAALGLDVSPRKQPKSEHRGGKRFVWRTPNMPKLEPYVSPKLSDAPESLNLEIEALGTLQCHFPSGDSVPYKFCGHSVKSGTPYCEFHCQVTRTPMYGNQVNRDNNLVAQINSGTRKGLW